jgi:outer membrane protein
MHTRSLTVLCLLAFLTGTPSYAQFANQSIGLSVGYMKLSSLSQSPEGNAPQVAWGLPVGLYGTTYLGEGFDLTYHVLQAMVLQESLSGTQILAIAPSIGVRYFFTQEPFRPYGGLDLTYLHIFGDVVANNFFGLGPNLGFDLFVNSTWSVGLRGQLNLYWWLNLPVQISPAITAEIATYY